MIKEVELIDKDNIIKKLEDFVKSFCDDDMEKYTDLIEGVNYAIAIIAATKPKAKIFEEAESENSAKIDCNKTKCENCNNHNYCDFESQKGADR